MLRVLIRKQLLEIFQRYGRRKNRANSGQRSRWVLLVGVLVLLMMVGMFTGLALILCKPLSEVNMSWMYFLILGGMSIIFGTFGSVFSTYFTLYMAKDNDLLLSMPIPERAVILSRLLSVYVMGLFYSGLISLPMAVVYWIVAKAGFAAVVGSLVLVLLISAIVLGLSCLLGWVVAKLSLRLKNKSMLTVLISLILVGLYYYVYFQVMDRIQNLVTDAIFYGAVIKDSAYPIYLFGRIGEGDWLGMGLWTLGILVLLGLIWLLLKKSFLSISTATPSGKKAVYREQESRQGSVGSALLRKELFRFTTSANYMLNCGLGIIFLFGVGVFLLVKGGKMLRDMGFLLSAWPGAMPVLLCAVCCMMVGMIDISAPSVSLEGKTIWQLQSLPVTPWQVLKAKLELHLLLAMLPTLFCVVCAAVVASGTLAQKLLLVAVALEFAVFFAMLGLTMGLKLPNLNWTNEVIPIKQSAAVNITVFSSMILGVALGGLYIWFGWRMGATAWLGLWAMILLAADAALFLWLRHKGAARFAAL